MNNPQTEKGGNYANGSIIIVKEKIFLKKIVKETFGTA